MVFRFVHAADLHLDSPFQSLRSRVPDSWREQLIDSTIHSLRRLVKLCLDQHVDCLLLSGDVFDRGEVSIRAQLRLREALEELVLKGIPVFWVAGNHDALDRDFGQLNWPAGVHRFPATFASVPFQTSSGQPIVVHGISYSQPSEPHSLVPDFPSVKDPTDAFHIGLLHTQMGQTDHTYAPALEQDLLEKAIDYWALGHIHAPTIVRSHRPTIAYPGCIQGRHFGESGPRGCYVVTVDATHRCVLEFHELGVVRWMELTLDLTDIEGIDQILYMAEAKVDQLLRSGDRRWMLRFYFEGRTSLYRTLAKSDVLEDLVEHIRSNSTYQNLVWIDSIVNHTLPVLDEKALALRDDFVGDVVRLAANLEPCAALPVELEQTLLEPLKKDRTLRSILRSSAGLHSSVVLAARNRLLDELLEDGDS